MSPERFVKGESERSFVKNTNKNAHFKVPFTACDCVSTI
jgi:hypothetical protein